MALAAIVTASLPGQEQLGRNKPPQWLAFDASNRFRLAYGDWTDLRQARQLTGF